MVWAEAGSIAGVDDEAPVPVRRAVPVVGLIAGVEVPWVASTADAVPAQILAAVDFVRAVPSRDLGRAHAGDE